MPARTLDFRTLDDAVAEIERLARDGYRRTGKWGLTEICEHLTRTMRLGMDGTGQPLPWIVRKTVGPWLLRRTIARRRMLAGLPAPPVVQPSPTETPERDDPETIARCVATLREAAAFEGPLVRFPLADGVSVTQWRELATVHAAHHLGFLVPQER